MKTFLIATVLLLSLVPARAANPQPQQLFALPCASGSGCADGADIQTILQASDLNFYGVAIYSSGTDGGTVFRITPSGSFTVLHRFVRGSSGIYPGGNMPNSLVEGPDGNLYGTTLQGGHDNFGDSGVLFRIAKNGSGFKVIHRFCAQAGCPDGNSPNLVMLASDGNLYGLTARGLFRYSPTTKAFTAPFAGLPFFFGPQFVQAPDGSFYGNALLNDTTGESAIWKVTAARDQTLVATYPNNVFPGSGLRASNGSLIGMYENADGLVGVFRLNLTTLQFQFLPSFSGVTPSPLSAALVLAKDGDFWIPDTKGGGFGRVLEISSTSGQIVNAFPFSGGNGQSPMTLIQASDGPFVGTTLSGGVVPPGSSSGGVIFTLNASGFPAGNKSDLLP